MEEPVRIAAPMPHTRVRQITDRPMSKAMLVATKRRSEQRNQSRREQHRAAAAADRGAGRRCRAGPRRWSICQEAVEAALKAGALPENIEVAHFNAITGLNAWSDVALLMVDRPHRAVAPRVERHRPGAVRRGGRSRSRPTRRATSATRRSRAASACATAPGAGSRATSTPTRAPRRCAGRSAKPN